MKAKPFIKWAGGKSKIINEIINVLPSKFENKKMTYVEPFLGGGSVFFGLYQYYNNFDRVILNDINVDLINSYITVRDNVSELIKILEELQCEYHSILDLETRSEFYYSKRKLYNLRNSDNISQAALFIFLNRTCFNGLYRVNKRNEFNVPIGSYIKPEICNKENLVNVSEILTNVEILSGDYEKTYEILGSEKAFFYIDPPYKPLNKTSQFNSYSHINFDDSEQFRLRDFCDKLNQDKHLWVLSNSDMSEHEKHHSFFDDLYSNYQIDCVNAKRYINSDPKKRGDLKELLIINNLEKNFNHQDEKN
ncbi:DNA adenine methylase [Chryseobacterium sp. 22543]|uniref:DNA adenine methylase n=1 Tax=Chryseobacterium sp. 22543 TaxID=3453940 RepID=UPI003F87792C